MKFGGTNDASTTEQYGRQNKGLNCPSKPSQFICAEIIKIMLEQSVPELLLTEECFRLQNFRQRGEKVHCSK